MTVLITGASRGIGLALTQQYLQRGETVLAVCREPTEELKATKAEIISGIDISSDADIAKLKAAVGSRKLSLLMNNAGVLYNEGLDSMDFSTIEQQWQVNALAPLKVTYALLGNLEKGSKIAFTSSRMASIEDNTSGAYYGYRMSKVALNAAGKSLAVDLKDQGISVALLHPGYVSTRMVGFSGQISADESAKGLIARIDALNLNNSGSFWHANGEVLPW